MDTDDMDTKEKIHSVISSIEGVTMYMKGMVDRDIAIKDTNVIINTNDVSFELPPLQLWHFLFTYKGKPIPEYGQRMKNMIKIHRSRAIVFLLTMGMAGRKRRKNQRQKTEDECMKVAVSSEQNKKDLKKSTK